MSSASRRVRVARILAVFVLYVGLPAMLLSGSARADQRVAVSRGERIRVFSTALAPDSVEGSLVDLEADTLVMASGPDSQVVALALASVRTLEVNRRVTHMAMYTGIGLLVGAGVGALWGAASYRHTPDELFSQKTDALIGGYLLAIPGAVVGFLYGAIGSQRWVPLDPAKLRLTWHPDNRGATVSALIRF
jgi:hypothetical protein